MKTTLKKNIKTHIQICSLIIITIFILILYKKIFSKKNLVELLYTQQCQADYIVNLKDNTYYEVKKLPSGMNYITSLIDTIDIKFNYIFTSTKDIDYITNYYIEATTRVYDKEKSKVLFEKSENLTDLITLEKNNIQYYTFQKNIIIDYNHFNDFAISFKNEYGLYNTSDVTITLKATSHGTNNNYSTKINQNITSSVVIPLTEQTINIKINSNDSATDGKLQKKFQISDINLFLFILLLITIVIEIIIIIIIIKKIIKSLKNKPYYQNHLYKILKEYDSIIANVNKINLKSTNETIYLSSFKELVDVHDNIGSPILYKETIIGKEAYFTIINENINYVYILRNNR